MQAVKITPIDLWSRRGMNGNDGVQEMPLVTIKEGPSQEDWSRHEPTIRRLYSDEDKPLKEVISIMEKDYRHKASIAMYKSRIRQWKLDKRNKSHDMDVIMHKKVKRDAVGKASAFQLRGRRVDLEDVFRYYKRKKVPVPRLATPDAATPPDMSYWTPQLTPLPSPTITSPRDFADEGAGTLLMYTGSQYDESMDLEMQSLFSPLPRPVTPPGNLLLLERLFNAIKIYYSGSLDNRTWVLNEQNDLISTRGLPADETQSMWVKVVHFSQLCYRSTNAFITKDFIQARQLLSKAFNLIKDVLIEEDPSTLEKICSSLFQFLGAGLDDISAMLRTFIGQMAVEVLPSNHPWCQLCKLIGNASAEDVRALSRNVWKCTKNTFASKLGPFHSRVIESELEFLILIQIQNDPVSAERRLRQLSAECEKIHGKSDARSISIALDLGFYLNEQEKYAEALALSESYLALALDAGIGHDALVLIAYSHYSLGNQDQAIKIQRERIELNATKSRRTDLLAIHQMGTLEIWLREWGRESEADDVREEIEFLKGPADMDEDLELL